MTSRSDCFSVATRNSNWFTDERAVSSIRNNGNHHGADALIKLVNLMGRDPEDLYLPPEAST